MEGEMIVNIDILSRHSIIDINKISFNVENELKAMQSKICDLLDEKIIIAKIGGEIFVLEMVKEKI